MIRNILLIVVFATFSGNCFAGKEYSLPNVDSEKQLEYINGLLKQAKSSIANHDYESAQLLLTERCELLDLYYEQNGIKVVDDEDTGYEYFAFLPKLYCNLRIGCVANNLEEIEHVRKQYQSIFKKPHPQYDLLETEVAETLFRMGNIGMAIETAERLIDRLNYEKKKSSAAYHKMYHRLMAFYESIGRTGTKYSRNNYRPEDNDDRYLDSNQYIDNDLPFSKRLVKIIEAAARLSNENKLSEARNILDLGLEISEKEFPEAIRMQNPELEQKYEVLKGQLLSMKAKTYEGLLILDDEARNCLIQNYQLNKKIHGDNSTELADAAEQLGEYCFIVEEDYKKAITYYQIAYHILKSANEFRKGQLINLLGAMMICHSKLDDSQMVASVSKELIGTTKDLVASTFKVSSSAERAALWDKYNHWLLRVIPRMAIKYEGKIEFGAELYDIALFSKGLLMMSDNAMTELALKKGNYELKEEGRTLQKLRLQLHEQLTSLNINNLLKVEITRRKIESVEHSLVAKVNQLGEWSSDLNICWQDVQKQLKKGETAIEFLEYGQTFWEEGAIIALVLSADSPNPIMRKLCSSNDLSYSADFIHCKTNRFYKSYWKSLEPDLCQTQKIFFSPAGVLNTIPIEYCLVDSVMSLFDKYDMYRLSSTRKLLERGKKKATISTVYLYGGIDYTPDLNKIRAANMQLVKEGYIANGTNGIDKDLQVNSLDSLSKKIEDQPYLMNIYKTTLASTLLLGEQLGMTKCNTHIFTDFRATEECFKAMSNKPIDVLYVNTHGFTSKDNLKTDKYSYTYKKDWVNVSKTELAMTLSGLLMAGASMAFSPLQERVGFDDGVITAAEIAQMNLKNVRLVHLSACQTGLGKITPEGVLGLQRGFKRAGAQAIITTLASVNAITSLYFDSVFYNALFADENGKRKKTQSIHSAFVSSVKKLRSAYKDVNYWCANVLIDSLD